MSDLVLITTYESLLQKRLVARVQLLLGFTLVKYGLVLSRNTGDVHPVPRHPFANPTFPCYIFRISSFPNFGKEQRPGEQ